MDIPNKYITDMQRQIDACSSYIDALAQGRRSPEKVNTLLDAAMQKLEMSCISMRRLCRLPRQRDQRRSHTDGHRLAGYSAECAASAL